MVTDQIPFVSSQKDCGVLQRHYPDSVVARVPLERWSRIASIFPSKIGLWVDPGVDGLHNWEINGDNRYNEGVKQFQSHDKIGNPEFQKKPDKDVVRGFIDSVMDACMVNRTPAWITIPQLPVVNDSGRNKINRCLAQFAGEWRMRRKFNGKLLLPIIFTKQNQVKGRTVRKDPLSLARKCYDDAGADGVWVADSSLNDQEGSGSLVKRFHGLIDFHSELNRLLPSQAITIAGPYWGINLILWTRGLVRHPAIGLGRTYRYHLPGIRFLPGNDHIALPPLRRWATTSQQLQAWLAKVVPKVPHGDKAYGELNAIQHNYNAIIVNPRNQVAEFYRKWLDVLASIPSSGRTFALFQQFSSAYVLGKALAEPLPKTEKTAWPPGRVAEQFMLSLPLTFSRQNRSTQCICKVEFTGPCGVSGLRTILHWLIPTDKIPTPSDRNFAARGEFAIRSANPVGSPTNDSSANARWDTA